jgi:predicted DNA-binding WGR domain protein
LNKQINLDIPVYTVWGACEDVRVLEKFRSGEYKVDNLHVLDEASSRLLDVGGVKLRLLGLGGAVVMHKLFDNGEGKTTIAGGQGTMWTTLLQMGELIDTANRVYDIAETRIFLTHASPAREGMLNQLSVTLKADFSISAGLHFRYGSSYNEFSVNPTLDHYRGKLAASKASFQDVWETVRTEVEQAILQNDSQKTLLENALDIVDRMPTVANGGNPFGGPVGGTTGVGQVDEMAFKNMWNFNLADAAFGYLVLEVDGGRIGTEMRAQGFNFAHRGGAAASAGKLPSMQPGPLQALPPQGISGAPASAPTGPAQNRGPAFAAPAQPFPQPPAQAPRAQPVPAASRPSPAPASAVTVATTTPAAVPTAPANQTKPLTPQSSAMNVNLPGNDSVNRSAASATNGTPVQDNKLVEAPKPTPSPVMEKKPATALYILNAETEEQIRDLFPEEDKSKIKSVSRFGKTGTAFMVNFDNHDECKAAFERQPSERKNRSKDPKVINIRYFEERSSNRNFHHRESQGGAGTWQGSSRGGASTNPRGGYQSGGASDSEGGRGGRGAYRARGGRGRGGDDRGGRAGGRGGGRGGAFSNQTKSTDGASDSKPAAAAATAASAGES